METYTIRPIKQEDNAAIAAVIRAGLTEFDAVKPGTVYFDPTTDDLYNLFADEPISAYWILEADGKVMGGGGIYPTEGLPNGCCELAKLYIAPEMRGKGFGKQLIEKCVESANDFGYEQMYLETMPELKNALGLYEACGFKQLEGPLGNSGHFGCDLWMLKEL
ncbi:MAG: acetyltransferase [Flavipsychrobacter sp.]|nr:acetyltransferase [Flavipsychrobacter sp.]